MNDVVPEGIEKERYWEETDFIPWEQTKSINWLTDRRPIEWDVNAFSVNM